MQTPGRNSRTLTSAAPFRASLLAIGRSRLASKDDCDFGFAPTSATAHGDWTSFDRYAVTRCRNPLHLWYRIPNSKSDLLVDPSFMDVAIDLTLEVVAAYDAAILSSASD